MRPAQAAATQAARLRRPRPNPALEREKPLKAGSGGDSTNAESTHDAQKAAAEETGAHSMEALAHALAHAESEGSKESKEAHAESHEQAEKEAKPSLFARVFGSKATLGKPQVKSPPSAAPQGKAQVPPQKPGKDGFEASAARGQALTSASYSGLAPVGALQNRLSGALPRLDRPPDAFSLLKEAKEQGVLFREDWQREGHSEDQDDPELAAAVEEAIRLLFGVRGVLRVGPGRDEAEQPVVVVVATHGFTDASLAAVPEKVHRFPTMLALSFDLLPLKREQR